MRGKEVTVTDALILVPIFALFKRVVGIGEIHLRYSAVVLGFTEITIAVYLFHRYPPR